MIKYTFETDDPLTAERICKSPAMAGALKKIDNLKAVYQEQIRGMASEESETARTIFRDIELIMEDYGINLSEI